MPDGTTTPRFGDNRLPERFWDKVRVELDGCWRWTGAKSLGYGKVGWDGKSVHAHLVAYRTLVGAIPDGLVADHECHRPETCGGGNACQHRACVNPAHIGLKPNSENTGRGRASHWNSRKTHCVLGHEFTEENTRRDKAGRRCCRSCERKRSAERHSAYRAENPIKVITHCPQGHEYTIENTRMTNGKRGCRTCERIRAQVKRQAQRMANPLPPVTHCPNGHEYTPENTGRKPSGARLCKACARAAKAAWRARQKR